MVDFGPGYTAFWAVAGVASAALVAGFTVPGLRRMLHFELSTASQATLSVGMGIAGFLAAAFVLQLVVRAELNVD